MEVEVYLEDETKALVFNSEELDTWKKQVQDLGLNGQISLTEKSKSPIPFRPMTVEEINVYRTCFGAYDQVESFSKEVIPLRVLSVLALAKSESYFTDIQIWSDPSGDDPILVGKIRKPGPDEFYLLARWGRALVSFSELKIEAAKRRTEKVINKAREQMAQAEAWMKNPQDFAFSSLRESFSQFA